MMTAVILVSLIILLTLIIPVSIGFSMSNDLSTMLSSTGFGQTLELQYRCQYC